MEPAEGEAIDQPVLVEPPTLGRSGEEELPPADREAKLAEERLGEDADEVLAVKEAGRLGNRWDMWAAGYSD